MTSYTPAVIHYIDESRRACLYQSLQTTPNITAHSWLPLLIIFRFLNPPKSQYVVQAAESQLAEIKAVVPPLTISSKLTFTTMLNYWRLVGPFVCSILIQQLRAKLRTFYFFTRPMAEHRVQLASR